MILLDTNILVYAVNTAVPQHAQCRDVVDRALSHKLEAVVFPQILLEFYSVVTSPRLAPQPMTPDDALAQLEDFQAAISVLHPNARCLGQWKTLCQKGRPVGTAVFDMFLVAQMQAHGVTDIGTLNSKDFAYPGITARTPDEI